MWPPGANATIPVSACHIEKFPAYVVNASTVKHVQLAVNFARNNNIRLTIKYVIVCAAYLFCLRLQKHWT